jgi:hypothetical protein
MQDDNKTVSLFHATLHGINETDILRLTITQQSPKTPLQSTITNLENQIVSLQSEIKELTSKLRFSLQLLSIGEIHAKSETIDLLQLPLKQSRITSGYCTTTMRSATLDKDF